MSHCTEISGPLPPSGRMLGLVCPWLCCRLTEAASRENRIHGRNQPCLVVCQLMVAVGDLRRNQERELREKNVLHRHDCLY